MIRTTLLFSALLGLVSANALAQMDVDQADSLNFQSFHKDKKEAVKVWKDNNGDAAAGTRKETIKTYDQTPVAPAASNAGGATVSSPVLATTPAANATAISGVKGQRFEIRERYALSRSTKTPYSAFFVIEPLYKEAAQLCVKGWQKLSEKSEPVEQDFYLYYEIECL